MNRLERLFAPNVSKHYEMLSRNEFVIQIGNAFSGLPIFVLKHFPPTLPSIIFPYCAPLYIALLLMRGCMVF